MLADHGVPMAIVTGAQRDDVRAVLAASPVGEVITVVVAEEDVRRGKPDPEGFRAGAALLGREPTDVLVFRGLGARIRALAAGMRCIAGHRARRRGAGGGPGRGSGLSTGCSTPAAAVAESGPGGPVTATPGLLSALFGARRPVLDNRRQ